MSRFVFLFDLDSTVTKQEILPTIAKEAGIYEQMRSLPEMTIAGEIPFKQSFLKRVGLLKDIPVSRIQKTVEDIELNEKLVDFIRSNKNRCYIVTANLDIWISKLVSRIGIDNNVFSSKAFIDDEDHLKEVISVVDKEAIIRQLFLPFVAVGAGNNDAEMIEAAKVGIGFGAVRPIAPSVLECATHAVYDEDTLVNLLEKLV